MTHQALIDAADLVRDCIEALAQIDREDAITDAIRDLEDVQGKLWKASALAEEAAGYEAMRQEALDLDAYRQAV